jgi:hypothetical protein
VKLALFLLASSICACAQSVEGSVVDAVTGAGIAGAKVELLRSTTPFYETATDSGGRFRFDNIKEGDYSVRYQSPGYWLTAGPTDYRSFPVPAGETVKLNARLMPWSRISGRVVDPKGRPVPKASVEVSGFGMQVNGRTYVRSSWGGGGGGLLTDSPGAMTFRGQTDAEGRFEVQLMPGSYELSVIPPPSLKPPEPEPDGPLLAWTQTYYPRAAVAEAATKIVAHPDGAVQDVEMKLLAVAAHSVRGLVVNLDGAPAPEAKVSLRAGSRFMNADAKADGTFEFPAVAEGEWVLSARTESNGATLQAAVEWIDVAGHDIDDLKLRLIQPLNVRGRVVVEPESKDAAPPPGSPFMLARQGGRSRFSEDFLPGGTALVAPADGGRLSVEGLYPGVYRAAARIGPAPATPFYLEAIRAGDADLLAAAVPILSDTTVTVVYRTDGGAVRGVAEACFSGGVLLVPKDPERRRTGASRSGACDAAGKYEILAVRPGEYYALAFAGNGPVLPVDETLLQLASRVTVRAGEASVLDLRAVTWPLF